MGNILKLKDEKFECFYLDWDTQYFGVYSARVVLNGVISEAEQDRILEYCKSFNFTTINNKNNIKENNYWIGNKTNAFLADVNIQFTKEIIEEPVLSDGQAEIYNSYPYNDKVISIARSSFQHSRFFNDPKLPKEKADNIYLQWTKGSFGQADKYFVIAERNNEIAGYILFLINSVENYATIELIAVDEKFQGKRVGVSLVSKMESFIYKNGINNIKVGTQVNNVLAAQFYLSKGFKYVNCSSIYHLWNY